LANGCGAAEQTHPGTFEGQFTATDTLTLEEPPGVITVHPVVQEDNGGYALVDVREAQFRRYDAKGRLLQSFGRPGAGPGEFASPPVSFVRTSQGHTLVLELGGTVSEFDSAGVFIRRTLLPLRPAFGLALLPGGLILVAGARRAIDHVSLLHVWEPWRDSLDRSFFTAPPVRNVTPAQIVSMSGASASVSGNTIVATLGVSDTLYTFSLAGEPLGKEALSLPSFRYHPEPLASTNDPRRFIEWMASGSRIERVTATTEGPVYVQFLDQNGAVTSYGLAVRRSSGKPWQAIARTPRMLVARSNGMVVFAGPEEATPNVWIVARLK
jgi:hypothetical protein